MASSTSLLTIEEMKDKLTDLKIQEDPKDIETLMTTFNNDPHKYEIIRCLLCNGKSGTLKLIAHHYKCKYASQYKDDRIRYSIVTTPPFYPKSNSIFPVMQREYIVTNEDIIGSFGAGPCIIVAMRCPTTKKTMLAHIDALTTSPMSIFHSQFIACDSVDVYLVGGDSSSKDMIIKILDQLSIPKYRIIYAHLVDSSTNSFAIDPTDGSICCYVNYDSFIKLDTHAINNGMLYSLMMMHKSPLKCVTI